MSLARSLVWRAGFFCFYKHSYVDILAIYSFVLLNKYMKPTKDKIAIVGSAPSSNMKAPYTDPEWEVWGLNFGANWMPRIDALFELHDPIYLQLHQKKHWEWLTTQKKSIPILMQRKMDGIHNSEAYPLQDLIDEFDTKYFTNSVSYMIAYAVHHNVKEIGLWGIDMSQSHQMDAKNEYAWQRPSCEFFAGIAVGRGIKFSVAEESDLLKTQALYGYQISTGDMVRKYKARRIELNTRIEEIDKALEDMSNQYNGQVIQLREKKAVLVGALDECQYSTQWLPEGEDNES